VFVFTSLIVFGRGLRSDDVVLIWIKSVEMTDKIPAQMPHAMEGHPNGTVRSGGIIQSRITIRMGVVDPFFHRIKPGFLMYLYKGKPST
jgi:hypothetical protein